MSCSGSPRGVKRLNGFGRGSPINNGGAVQSPSPGRQVPQAEASVPVRRKSVSPSPVKIKKLREEGEVSTPPREIESPPDGAKTNDSGISSNNDSAVVTSEQQVDVPFAAKPDPGTEGRKIGLQANLKQMTLPMDSVLYRYEVEIVASDQQKETGRAKYRVATKGAADDYERAMKRSICWDVYKKAVSKAKEHFPLPYGQVYDRHRMLFSKRSLNVPIVIPRVRVDAGTYDLKIHAPLDAAPEVKLGDIPKIGTSDQDRVLIQVLELATSQQLYKDNTFLSYGRNFYDRKKQSELGAGKYLAEGFSKSVRIVEGETSKPVSAVQIDLKKSAIFKEQPAIDTIKELFRFRNDNDLLRPVNPRQKDMLNRTFRGLRVKTLHRPKINTDFVVQEITKASASDLELDVDGRRVSVAQFFEKTYRRLSFPNLPCFVRRTPKRKEYYPIEVCLVLPNQRVNIKQQTEDQMRDMIRKTAVAPSQRLAEIRKLESSIRLDDTNKFLAKLHISIDPSLMALEGRVLPALRMQYKSQSRVVRVDEMGNWDMQGQKWFIRGKCKAYVALMWGDKRDGERTLKGFIEQFGAMAAETGIKLPKRPVFEDYVRTADDLPKMFKDAEKEEADFILIIMSRKDDDFKSQVKYLEQQTSVITQCVLMQNANICAQPNNRKGQMTLLNILAKTNMKLGGLNYVIDEHMQLSKEWLAPDVMFVGCDVNHPPPLPRDMIRRGVESLEPSVVGMVASTNNEKMQLSMDYYYQSPRVEEVKAIRVLMLEMMERYKRQNDKLPKRIVYYRDGVAEGQFKMVLEKEVPGMEAALRQMGGADYRPKLTVLICQKRHNTRFFTERMQGPPAAQNVPPGTVVDTTVVSPREWEFFLCSHMSPQGTAKAVKYTVLRDDNLFEADDLQGLTFLLAHGHQIITKTVSLPAPVMGAHNAAMRGKKVWKAFNGSDEISQFSGDREAPNWDVVSNKLRAKEGLKDKMYWA